MSIEQTLSSMAYRQLTQNMPSMSSYLLGFELITNNEDNTLALGVNVALIGDTYVFIPTIMKNGRISPVDLMYVPELDQFLPCKDAWITYIQSKKTDLVATLNKKKNRQGSANAVDLNMPFDNFTKTASADVKQLLKCASQCMIESLCNAPSNCDIPGVPELVDFAGINGLRKLANYIESTDGYNNMVEFYSNADIQSIVEKLQKRINEETITEIGSDGEVKILTSASTEARDLPTEDKVRILRDGAVIKDNRGLTPSIVYKEKTNAEWCTPAEDGVYELLKIDGTTMTAYVFNKNTLRGNTRAVGNKEFYVVPLDDAQARNAYEVTAPIIGQPYADISNIKFHGKNIINIANDQDTYEFIIKDSKGNAKVVHMSRPEDGSTLIHKDDELILMRPLDIMETTTYNHNSRFDSGTSRPDKRLRGLIIGKAGAKMRSSGEFLRIGEDATYFSIVNSYNSADMSKNISKLATVDSMLDALKRRAGNLSVNIFKADSGVYIESDLTKVAGVSDIEAEYCLVRDLALTPEDAHELVKIANDEFRYEHNYIVKIAADTHVALSAPEFPMNNIETNNINLGPMSNMSEDDKNVLNSAVASGTKEVFDVSILRLLAEDDSPTQIINEWMPSLFTALDKLGRILYLCRAGDSMQDSYGVDRVDSIEKKLRRQFNELGDIILTMLKGKIKDFDDLRNGEL